MKAALAPYLTARCSECAGTGDSIRSNLDCSSCGGSGYTTRLAKEIGEEAARSAIRALLNTTDDEEAEDG